MLFRCLDEVMILPCELIHTRTEKEPKKQGARLGGFPSSVPSTHWPSSRLAPNGLPPITRPDSYVSRKDSEPPAGKSGSDIQAVYVEHHGVQ